jgi:vancomycin resistance protein YoaR
MSSRHPSQPSRGRRGSIYFGLAGGLFLASGALFGTYLVMRSDGTPTAEASTTAAPAEVATPEVTEAVTAYLAEPVEVVIGASKATMHWADLGVSADPALVKQVRAGGNDVLAAARAAGAMPVVVDHAKALAALHALKATHDRAPTDARLDLEAHAIHDDTSGYAIDVYASLARIELAARVAAPSVELVSVALPAAVTKATLGIDDISHVLGTWKTTFPVGDKDRNFNLKLAASHLNGYVLKPGEEMSFNGVVGDRTEKQGYRIAHVITAGEMVDGLAGGTCQISTTLHAAAFFAGLEFTDHTPHSRPSTYMTIGMDATVVYPTTDLKIKNPYDFPVVIMYRVARGEAQVEILGKKRPWDEIVFESRVYDELPFQTVTREDDSMPMGSSIIDQPGFPGYKVKRFRRFMKDGKEIKSDSKVMTYKTVTEYVRIGTNPDPNLVPPVQGKLANIPNPGGGKTIKQ